MNSAHVLDNDEIGSREVARESADDERRIRRAMRLKPDLFVKKTHGKLPAKLVGGAALLGAFCLGWKAFGVWHE